jgi:hypothetical protein
VLHGRMAGEVGDAIVYERYAPDGRICDIMILIRPLRTTKSAIARMGRLLEAAA